MRATLLELRCLIISLGCEWYQWLRSRVRPCVLGRLLYVGLLLSFSPRPPAGGTSPLSLLAFPTSVNTHLLDIACSP